MASAPNTKSLSDSESTIATSMTNSTEEIFSQKPSTVSSVVSNIDFATELRTDRLNLLWRISLGIAIFLLWIAFMRRQDNGDAIAMMCGFIIVGSVLTRFLLKVNYTLAVWSFVGGGILATTVLASTGNQDAINISPFIYPFIVFMVGLMLPPIHTASMFIISTILTFTVPFIFSGGSWEFISVYPFAAVAVTFLSAIFAIQATGELYQVTGWALENYQRERRTSGDLFENRQRLEKSLQRSQILGEKLQEINDELEMAKHFRGQFLANMSHELRTPLNAIIGFSETMLSFPMMYDDIPLPGAYRNDLEQIYGSGNQLLTVINDILDLSKVDAGKLEVNLGRVSLDPLIDSVMMTAAGLVAKKPIELKRDLPRPLPDVYADDTRLRQVLLNIYSNAAKFTESGTVTIGLQEFENEVHLSIKDTGEGIKSDALESIFEEFSQTETAGRDPRTGAGLGLTISRRLLALMNGRIWAESTYSEGSTFYVVVPKYQPGVHGGDVKEKSNRTPSPLKPVEGVQNS